MCRLSELILLCCVQTSEANTDDDGACIPSASTVPPTSSVTDNAASQGWLQPIRHKSDKESSSVNSHEIVQSIEIPKAKQYNFDVLDKNKPTNSIDSSSNLINDKWFKSVEDDYDAAEDFFEDSPVTAERNPSTIQTFNPDKSNTFEFEDIDEDALEQWLIQEEKGGSNARDDQVAPSVVPPVNSTATHNNTLSATSLKDLPFISQPKSHVNTRRGACFDDESEDTEQEACSSNTGEDKYQKILINNKRKLENSSIDFKKMKSKMKKNSLFT